jgi:hypothetical protein
MTQLDRIVFKCNRTLLITVIFQNSFYVEWGVLLMHMTLSFICIYLILFIIYKSKAIKWWNVTLILFLLVIILILAPETYIEYLCCSVDPERIVLLIFFGYEMSICGFEIIYLIHLRNERLRRKFGLKPAKVQ